MYEPGVAAMCIYEYESNVTGAHRSRPNEPQYSLIQTLLLTGFEGYTSMPAKNAGLNTPLHVCVFRRH